MNWTRPRDMKAQLERLWERGELPRRLITGELGFPIRLVLKGPASSDLSDRFEAVRAWTAELAAAPHVRIEWREVRHRVQGSQRLPEQIWVDTPDDALALIGKRRDAERLVELADLTRSTIPELLPWMARRPLQAVDLADQWAHLLAVVRWLVAHPRPGIYLRQVDVPGVHSKFIEAHRAVLSELLDLVLPPDSVQSDRTGVGQFARRYGFLDKPVRIRFRVLDGCIRVLPSGAASPDVTVDADSFARLQTPISRVFVTENETNFLAFPPASNAIVIFGEGYGWEPLARAEWLTRCSIHYWGDIDTHGFAILDQLRRHLGHVQSLLMDRDTLMAHKALWGGEARQVLHELPRLTTEERALYDDLRDNRIRSNLRLEQERVGFQWVTDALTRVADSATL